MTTRRDFIAVAIGSSAAIGSVTWPLSAAAECTEFLHLHGFVYDASFSESAAAGVEAARRGLRVLPLSGSLTTLWQERLRSQWKSAPRALAGITTPGILFMLEILAMDHGMRVVWRGTHQRTDDSRRSHVVRGPSGATCDAAAGAASSPWYGSVVGALIRCPAVSSSANTISWQSPLPSSATDAGALSSWIIAPRTALSVRA